MDGDGWSVRGRAGEGISVGSDAIAVVRVEQVRLTEGDITNGLELPLLTSMYLGDRWEYLFRTEGGTPAHGLALRAYGQVNRAPGRYRLELPAEHVWVFPAKA